jgi:tRNA (guanine-N7-)-methyltransferase
VRSAPKVENIGIGIALLYGRRKGHPLKPQQAVLMETLLPRLAIDLARRAPADLGELFPNGPTAVRVEIGFGAGEHLIGEAEREPRSGFIGVEPFLNGMARALSEIAARKLTNVRLVFGDAIDLLDWLPPASVARLDLIYPDPWPKRRHWKRRFVQDSTVAAFSRVLRPGGEFRFVSDWPDYVAWTLSHTMHSAHFDWTAECADDWRAPWNGFTATRYESKAKLAGRSPCYLVFRRTARALANATGQNEEAACARS